MNIRIFCIHFERHKTPGGTCRALCFGGGPAYEIRVFLEADEPVQPCFRRRVVGRKLRQPAPKEFIQPERHHGAHAKWGHPVGLPGIPERGPQLSLGHRVAVNLVAQIAGIADALHDAVGHAHCHALHVHEFQIDRLKCAGRENLARLRARDLKPRPFVGDIFNLHVRPQVLQEPAHVKCLTAV